MRNIKQIAFLILLISTINSCDFTKSGSQNSAFEGDKYFLPINPDWKFAFDDVKYSESALVLESKDSVWAVLIPGTLTLQKDTISVNQEAGFPNRCISVGSVKIGESKKIDYLSNETIFKRINDTLIEFDSKQYIKTDKTILSGCNCEWIFN